MTTAPTPAADARDQHIADLRAALQHAIPLLAFSARPLARKRLHRHAPLPPTWITQPQHGPGRPRGRFTRTRRAPAAHALQGQAATPQRRRGTGRDELRPDEGLKLIRHGVQAG